MNKVVLVASEAERYIRYYKKLAPRSSGIVEYVHSYGFVAYFNAGPEVEEEIDAFTSKIEKARFLVTDEYSPDNDIISWMLQSN